MSLIKKIKLPNEDPRDIGALSSNITYNADQENPIGLNEKIESVDAQLATKAGITVATTTTAGLMSPQDKANLDRVAISGASPVTLSGGDSIEINDADEDDVVEFTVKFDPQITKVPGNNILNPATNIEGYWIGANGKMTAQEGDWYSDLIPVNTGDAIYVSGKHNQTTNGNKRLHGYDANGNWVMQLNFASVPAGTTIPRSYSFNATVPSTVKYMRFSYRVADTEVMISKGSALPYEPYGEVNEFDTWNTSFVASHTSEGETYPATLPSNVYGGELNVLTGVFSNEWGHIASYDGETVGSNWYSTNEDSGTAATPTSGSEVIYELPTPTTTQLTAYTLETVEGYNTFEINEGEIKAFTYMAKGSIVSNLNITSGVVTLGGTSLNEQQLQQLLQLLS